MPRPTQPMTGSDSSSGTCKPTSDLTYRQELSAQLHIALPILGGQLAQTANGFVDTLMAGRVSAEDLAAVAVGASIWVPVYLFMTGVLMSTTPVLSRHLGGQAYHRINPTAQQALWLSLGLGIIGLLVLQSMEPLMRWMDVDASVLPIVSGYLAALSLGMPGVGLFLAMRSFTEAHQHTRPVLWISVAGLLINIPANYAFIYGHFGFPAMGGVGCGWATALVMWSMTLMMAGYLAFSRFYESAPLTLKSIHLEWQTMGRLLALGLPVGLSIFFEVSVFAIIALLISTLGAVTVAGHQIALNFASLIFMIPLSMALAVTVRVGHARGEQKPGNIRIASRVSLTMTFTLACFASLLLALGHQWIPYLYTDDPQVIEIAAILLLFAAIFQISDAAQVTINGVLRGFEDTRTPMLITLVAYWGIGLPTGYILGMTNKVVTAMGPVGFWLGLLAGLTSAALLLGLRLRWQLRRPVSRHD